MALRVLHVIPSVSVRRGGPSQGVLELARCQTRTNVDSTIATTNDHGEETMVVPLNADIEHSGAQVRFFQKLSRVPRPLREFTISLPFSKWLSDNARDFDLVHVHAIFSYVSSNSMRICTRLGVPYIVRPSGLLCRWALQQRNLKKRIYLSLMERKNLERSAAIEYTSELELTEASELGLRAPTYVIPYGIHPFKKIDDAKDLLRQQLGVSPERRVVLFMSRLHPKKGIELLLSAFEEWQCPEKLLVIAGNTESEYDRMIMNRARNSRCRDSIIFRGFAESDEKSLLLQGTDVFVLPSYSESFGIAVAESIAAGTAVITTNGVPLAGFVTENDLGWIIEPVVEQLADQLEKVFSADGSRIRHNVSSTGPARIEQQFGWPTITTRVEAMYRSVLNLSGN